MGNFHEINIVSASFERGASGSGGVERKTVLGKWEVDPQDETSVQFRIPSESLGLVSMNAFQKEFIERKGDKVYDPRIPPGPPKLID